jgi:hypothetical protein
LLCVCVSFGSLTLFFSSPFFFFCVQGWAEVKGLLRRWCGRSDARVPDTVIRLAVRCVCATNMRGYFRHAGIPCAREEEVAQMAAAAWWCLS